MLNEFHYADKENPLNYILFYPETTELSELPLLIYLHGAGERGGEISHLFRHGVPKMIEKGVEYPAVVLCPQCPCEFVWNNIVVQLKALIDLVAKRFNTKPDRICITGSSMGGFGTWEMGLTYPNFFSAIGPVAGGGLSWRCSNLVSTPVYAIHGDADTAVPPIYSELMVNAVNGSGGAAKYKVLENFGHNDGINEAYENTDLTEWLLAQRRSDFSEIAECCSNCF